MRHSASETVRGNLLSVEGCAKQLKECRRVRHRLLTERPSGLENSLRALSRRELLGQVAQRLLAAGYRVGQRTEEWLDVSPLEPDHSRVNVSAFCPDQDCSCYLAREACVRVNPKRGAGEANMGGTGTGCLWVTKDLLSRSPRLVLQASLGIARMGSFSGPFLTDFAVALARAESSVGRAHARALQWLACPDLWLRATAVGVDGAVVMAIASRAAAAAELPASTAVLSALVGLANRGALQDQDAAALGLRETLMRR